MQVDARQDCEYVCLNDCDHEFQSGNRNQTGQRNNAEHTQCHDKAADNFQNDVSHRHVGKQTDAKADGTGQIGNQLDRDQNHRRPQRCAVWKEQGAEFEPVFCDPDNGHRHKYNGRHSERNGNMAGEGETARNHTQQVSEKNEDKQSENEGEVRLSAAADIVADHIGHRAIEHLRHHLTARRDRPSAADTQCKKECGHPDRNPHKGCGIGEGNIDASDIDLNQPIDTELLKRISSQN